MPIPKRRVGSGVAGMRLSHREYCGSIQSEAASHRALALSPAATLEKDATPEGPVDRAEH